MNEDEKMIQIGLWSFGAVILLTVGLQVCYRTQIRTLKHVRAEIVNTQKEIAVAVTKFEGYKRPEVLRNLVAGVIPRAEAIGYHKSVSIDALPDRK